MVPQQSARLLVPTSGFDDPVLCKNFVLARKNDMTRASGLFLTCLRRIIANDHVHSCDVGHQSTRVTVLTGPDIRFETAFTMERRTLQPDDESYLQTHQWMTGLEFERVKLNKLYSSCVLMYFFSYYCSSTRSRSWSGQIVFANDNCL